METHTKYLGQLIGNFQAIEFLLRNYLLKKENGSIETALHTINVGDEINENSLTNYDSLRQLIQKYNKHQEAQGKSTLNPDITEIRDALAHGRIFSPSIEAPMYLLKFDKPYNSMTRVTFNEAMTDEWFKKNIRLTWEILNEILNNYNLLINN